MVIVRGRPRYTSDRAPLATPRLGGVPIRVMIQRTGGVVGIEFNAPTNVCIHTLTDNANAHAGPLNLHAALGGPDLGGPSRNMTHQSECNVRSKSVLDKCPEHLQTLGALSCMNNRRLCVHYTSTIDGTMNSRGKHVELCSARLAIFVIG